MNAACSRTVCLACNRHDHIIMLLRMETCVNAGQTPIAAFKFVLLPVSRAVLSVSLAPSDSRNLHISSYIPNK